MQILRIHLSSYDLCVINLYLKKKGGGGGESQEPDGCDYLGFGYVLLIKIVDK